MGNTRIVCLVSANCSKIGQMFRLYFGQFLLLRVAPMQRTSGGDDTPSTERGGGGGQLSDLVSYGAEGQPHKQGRIGIKSCVLKSAIISSPISVYRTK